MAPDNATQWQHHYEHDGCLYWDDWEPDEDEGPAAYSDAELAAMALELEEYGYDD